GRQYNEYFMQTDAALSESTCAGTGPGCAVPPPNAPGGFYPYWSRTGSSQSNCTILFGNVSGSGISTFGKDAQYGTDQAPVIGYPEFEGALHRNTCT
ncbi:MAG TPA: hypothetical protein VE992_05945, partial [Solirubrobacteraceae bacterium]|nr:hypothetical protein [Solirubrobacteraceae bacterium]